MEARGGQNNAATWVDWTYYRAKLPRWELDFVCELEADRIVNLALAADMLEREREVVVNERLMRVDNDPDGKLYEAIYRTAFGDHPYGVPTIGWLDDIRAITLADCLEFYRTYYAPNNVTLIVVGDVATADVLARVQAHYGSFAHQAIPEEAERPLPPMEGGPRRLTLTLPLATARMVLAWPAVPAGTPEHAALELAASILTDGESSRLHRALVEEHELALDVTSWVASCHDAGLFEVSMALRPGVDPARAEAVLHATLAAFLAGPLTARELMKAQNGLEAAFLKGQADVGTRARQLGHALLATGRWAEVFQEQALLRATTADDVLRVARAVMRPERQTIAWALPSVPAPDEPEGDSGDEGDDGDGDPGATT
jgi:zinc protease